MDEDVSDSAEPSPGTAETQLRDLPTPSLVLDEAKLTSNLKTMWERVDGLGTSLRPHLKTAKSADVARLALDGRPTKITVSTLKEAAYFHANGFSDILYAVAITRQKLVDAARLAREGANLTILLDSVEAASMVADAARELDAHFNVMIEVDTDGHRAGVAPDDPVLITVADTLTRSGRASLAGVLTHAGSSYNSDTEHALRAVARREKEGAVAAAEALRRAGHECPVVSIGSTPTVTFSEDLTGVTEVRAGVYMFGDLVMAGLGVCAVEDIAISVIATVIGHQKPKGWVIVDAGWMALSRDRGTASQAVDQGYGVVCDVESGKPIQDLIVSSANQEHGIISRRGGEPFDASHLPIGSRVRILPNHACATAAMHDWYEVLQYGAINTRWERVHGWRSA